MGLSHDKGNAKWPQKKKMYIIFTLFMANYERGVFCHLRFVF